MLREIHEITFDESLHNEPSLKRDRKDMQSF